MKVIILAAGRGTRMGDLTESKQKAMLEIKEKPLLHITFDNMIAEGFKDFIFVVGFMKQDVVNYFNQLLVEDRYKDVKVSYVEQENYKAGTANAVGVTRDFNTSSFVLIYGDVIPPPATVKAIRQFTHRALMITRRVTDPERYGVVETSGDTIIAIHEKTQSPPSNLINAGIYVLPSGIYKYISETPKSERGEYEFTTSLELFMKDGGVLNWLCMEDILDIGTKEEYRHYSESTSYESDSIQLSRSSSSSFSFSPDDKVRRSI